MHETPGSRPMGRGYLPLFFPLPLFLKNAFSWTPVTEEILKSLDLKITATMWSFWFLSCIIVPSGVWELVSPCMHECGMCAGACVQGSVHVIMCAHMCHVCAWKLMCACAMCLQGFVHVIMCIHMCIVCAWKPMCACAWSVDKSLCMWGMCLWAHVCTCVACASAHMWMGVHVHVCPYMCIHVHACGVAYVHVCVLPPP